MKFNIQFQNLGQEIKLLYQEEAKQRFLGKREPPSNLYFLGITPLLLTVPCGPVPSVGSK